MIPEPRRLIGVVDDYSRELDELEKRAQQNTIELLRRSLRNVMKDLRRSYDQYVNALGPVAFDPQGQPIRRPGAYSAAEATAKFRAILRDASQFLNPTELQQWQQQYEVDLREATQLGGKLGEALATMVSRPDSETPFTGADPLAVRAAALTTGAYIQGEGARFRDQLVQIVGEGATRGWGHKRLELSIRQALQGAKDPNGLTQQMGLEQRAALIARSELANSYVQGSLMRARQQGDAYVRVLASNDERTCPICASRNGRVFPLDRVPIPYHPRCRCVAVGVPTEAVQERDTETRATLLDSQRWQEEHMEGVKAYAKAKGITIEKAQADLAKALKTPSASEKRLYPKNPRALQESVPLFH